MVLPQAQPGSDLLCGFTLADHSLTVSVTAQCTDPQQPSRDGFAWTVLNALTSSVSAELSDDQLTITLSRDTSDRG